VLAYQGLPTATTIDYLLSDAYGSALTGHSLGGLDVANLAGWGLASGHVYALPFGMTAGGVDVTLGVGDAINGFGYGWFLNPGANVVDTGFLGHACASYTGCGL
jgi:hypothetical protein